MPTLILLWTFATISARNILFAADFIRHGARGNGFRHHPFHNISWKHGSELTELGERQHNLLGRQRREKYILKNKLLPEAFDPSQIIVKSTDVKRAQNSARSYILGLYPTGIAPLNELQLKHAKDWLAPPISLTIGENLIDELKEKPISNNLPMPAISNLVHDVEKIMFISGCPRFKKNCDDFFTTEKYTSLITKKYRATWDNIIHNYPSISISYLTTKVNAYALADFLVCADFENRRPERVTIQDIQQLKKFLGDIQWSEFSFEMPIMSNISMHFVTKELVARMDAAKSPEKHNPRFVLYSGHDTTIVCFFIALQKLNSSLSLSEVPTFASSLLFEFYEENGEFRVEINYNGEVIHDEAYGVFREKFLMLGELKRPFEEICRSK